MSEAIGPVEAELVIEEMPHCTVGVNAELCLASWDSGKDSGAGDDHVNTTRFVKRVGVSVEAPGAPHQRVVLEPSEMVVRHPVNFILNDTWLRLNDSIPSQAKPYLALESRPIRGSDLGPWTLFVVVYYPMPIEDPTSGQTLTYGAVPVYSWDCRFYFSSEDRGDETCTKETLRPLPNGLRESDNSDHLVEHSIKPLSCSYAYDAVVTEWCPVFNVAHAAGTKFVTAWTEASPNVSNGAGVERVEAEVTPARDYPDVEEAPPLRGRTHPLYRSVGDPSLLWSPRLPVPPLPREGAMSPSASPEGAPAARAWVAPVEVASVQIGTAPWEADLFVVAVIAAGFFLLSLGLALYHRIGRDRTLENANRQRVFEAVREQPGVRAGTLQALLGLNYETVLRHLKTLERAGLIEGVGEGQRRYFASGGAYSAREKREIVAAASPAAKAIRQHLAKHGEVEFSALCRALGLPRSTASEAVTRLQNAGLLVKKRVNGRLVVALPFSS